MAACFARFSGPATARTHAVHSYRESWERARPTLITKADMLQPKTPFRTPTSLTTEIQTNGYETRPGFEPSEAFVTRVSAQISRRGPLDSGFALIPNILEYVAGIEEARHFAAVLVQRVWSRVFSAPPKQNQNDNTHNTPTWRPLHHKLRQFIVEDGKMPHHVLGNPYTFKPLHFDPNSTVFAHCYGPLHNVLGGDFLFADVRGYLSAHNSGKPPDQQLAASDLCYLVGGKRQVLREEYVASAAFAPFLSWHAACEGAILMVNNTPEAGLAHGVSEVAPARSGTPMYRHFLRCSIAPPHQDGSAAAVGQHAAG